MGIRAEHWRRYGWPCGVILIKAHQAFKEFNYSFAPQYLQNLAAVCSIGQPEGNPCKIPFRLYQGAMMGELLDVESSFKILTGEET